MKKLLKVFVLAAFVASISSSYVIAEDLDDSCGVTQAESLGEGEYMTDDGSIVQTDDIGGGDEMSDSGDIYQNYGSGEGEYSTSTGGLVTVDE